MYRYKFWIKDGSGCFFNTVIMADDDMQARQIGEGMFGKDKILNYTRIFD